MSKLGVANFEQPAKDWLADAIENLAALVKAGEAPIMEVRVLGVAFEFRLKEVQPSAAPESLH
uniref:hypothetical protein n=1 Tax=Marinobacterium profundum TaxID=1714300 RepID=UPI00082B06B2|nr:hypothetical protein [Marinobacterium profundum]